MKFKAERIDKRSTIELNGPVEKVFPLFGPVLEKKWAEGWNPEIIYSTSALIEEHMIFKTRSDNEKEVFTWIITQYQPERYLIEYTVSAFERIWFIRVECSEMQSGTKAVISYTYTGFTQQGHETNLAAMEKMFVRELKDWEEAINYYLKNGKQLLNQ